jgi:hypothetical protein
MYYEVAEKRNAALTAVIPSPAPASTGPKGSVSGNDFNKLMGGGYQTDWVDAQGKPKGANGGKKVGRNSCKVLLIHFVEAMLHRVSLYRSAVLVALRCMYSSRWQREARLGTVC